MPKSAKEEFFSLLFEGERELLNIKFVLGERSGLTEDDVFEAAYKALAHAFSSETVSAPPVTGREPRLLRDALASF